MIELHFETGRGYADPFNEVELDVIFQGQGASMRIPAFWRGEGRWTVRFAPPLPGRYHYWLECSDRENADLNGRDAEIETTEYTGDNPLYAKGNLRVSANGRYFEHSDGTPFFWLGDTWWSNLSTRLSREDFGRLTADRKAKGFTVIQIVAGLIPSFEEKAPDDPGFCNEGGAVWEAGYKCINPAYFEHADQRIAHLIDNGLLPVIFGGWTQVSAELGEAKLKRHWRYIIARYGAWPVLWSVGGEIYERVPGGPDYPAVEGLDWRESTQLWAKAAGYIREIDPYGHPLAVHEMPPPFHGGFADLALTDFDMPQPGHWGWSTLATQVAQISWLRARQEPIRPVIQSESGYEQLGGEHAADFQRAAFWLAMLNGAAGHTYGALEVAEAYTADKPLHRKRFSFTSWEEAMAYPGAAQLAVNASILRAYPWHRFEPRPDWVTPRGTTLFEPHREQRLDLDLMLAYADARKLKSRPTEYDAPTGIWRDRQGSFRNPYAAGIPGEVRFVYIPWFGAVPPPPPTILGLEQDVIYRASYRDPVHGTRIDLGRVGRAAPGPLLGSTRERSTEAIAGGRPLRLVPGVAEANLVATVPVIPGADCCLALRYRDEANFVAAIWSDSERALFLQEWIDGKPSDPAGRTEVAAAFTQATLEVELRDGYGALSLDTGSLRITSPIVPLVARPEPGAAGITVPGTADLPVLEIRASPALDMDTDLERDLYDTAGNYRGTMAGTPEWDSYGRSKLILLDAWRPEKPPFPQDWLLVLDATVPAS